MSLKTFFNRPSPSKPGQMSRRMRAALVVGFVAAGAMLLINESAHTQTASMLQSVRVSSELLRTVNSLLRELAMAESAQRGYVLTADTAYLAPYRRSKDEVQKYVRQLDGAVALDADMREEASDLTKAVAQKFGEMDLVIRLRGQNKTDAANFVVSTNVGLDEMQRTRALGAQLIESASEQVVDNRVEIFRLLNVTRFGLAAGILAALFAFVLYTQQTRQMQRNDEEYNRSLEAERDALESQVQERTSRLTELATHLQHAVEDERAHLARELHDELGALLTAAKLDVARLKSRLPGDSPELADRVKHLTETLNQGIALKRRIIEDLRPSSLSNLGLMASLEILLREFGERSHIEMESALEPVTLNDTSDLTIYRVVQESLTNIGKYAQAKRVTVTLKNYVYHVELSVTDDGIGFNPGLTPHASHGLVGMRHRIEACGGRLDVTSAPGQGTRITATIPRQQRKPQGELASAMDDMHMSSDSYTNDAQSRTTVAG
ncbi:CHASE3 domain-containing protein [Ottowia oryzae]|nr:CHASE3 domain-containing protein [Ottowia oryzae]